MLRDARNADLPVLSELISLKGKRGLITGSGAGIGRAIAYRFAEAGACPELVDVDEEGLKKTRDALSKFNVEVDVHRVDLSRRDAIDSLWDKLAGKEPDILVNNAGVYPFRDFLEVDEAFLRKVMDINLNSVFWMCQHMIKKRLNRGGVIINVGSIEAVLPFEKRLTHYDSSRAGVIAITRALAKEYGTRGFRVNALVPGGIMTKGTRNVTKELYKLKIGVIKSGLKFRMRLPIGRMGQPDEVARVALVLASDLSSYMHGALVVVDGGFLSS